MHRIDTSSRAQNLFGAGKDGYTVGDPVGGVAATQTSADHLNAFQEEIARVVEGYGLPLTKANDGQLLQALGLMLSQLQQANWKEGTSGSAQNINGAAYFGGTSPALFMVCDSAGSAKVVTSIDGINWSVQDTLTSNSLRAIATDPIAGIVAVGDLGAIVYSAGAGAWAAQASGTTNGLKGIAIGNGIWVAVGVIDTGGAGHTGHGTVLTSTDHVTWTAHDSGVAENLNAVAYDGAGHFVAVGDDGTVLYSADGATWTAEASGVGGALYGVCYSSLAGWVAVGDVGTIITSPNGLVWTVRTTSAGPVYRAVGADSRGAVVACGDNGLLSSSLDGVTWVKRFSTLAAAPHLYAIASGLGLWACGGLGGALTLSLRS